MNNSPEAPIGVFDSGVGGLSVLAEIQRLMPNERLLYVGDCGHIPYGEKTPEFIRQRCMAIAEFFQEKGAKALVIACNTATAAAAADLRQQYSGWPIVGMEPAVKPAALATRNGVVGVLATTGTLQSARFAALLDRFASTVTVVTQPCPGLVELIEQGDMASARLRALVIRYVRPLLVANCDTIILGCTHYPFLKPLLAEILPSGTALVDTGAAVARQLQRLLADRHLVNTHGQSAPEYWTSGNVSQLRNVLQAFGMHSEVVLPLGT